MSATREGFSLIEVVVAMVLLTVILVMLAPLTYTAAQQTVVTADGTQRHAATQEVVNRLHTLPYAALAASAGCDTVGGVNARFERCVTVTAGAKRTTVRIVTTPLQRNPAPVTVQLVRTAPPTTSVLCTSGC